MGLPLTGLLSLSIGDRDLSLRFDNIQTKRIYNFIFIWCLSYFKWQICIIRLEHYLRTCCLLLVSTVRCSTLGSTWKRVHIIEESKVEKLSIFPFGLTSVLSNSWSSLSISRTWRSNLICNSWHEQTRFEIKLLKIANCWQNRSGGKCPNLNSTSSKKIKLDNSIRNWQTMPSRLRIPLFSFSPPAPLRTLPVAPAPPSDLVIRTVAEKNQRGDFT